MLSRKEYSRLAGLLVPLLRCSFSDIALLCAFRCALKKNNNSAQTGIIISENHLMVVPRGRKFIAELQDGIEGISWTTKYGGVAIAGSGNPYFLDGMNEAGLAVGAFYLPGFATYQDSDPSLGIVAPIHYIITDPAGQPFHYHLSDIFLMSTIRIIDKIQ